MSLDIATFGCRLNAHESEIIRGHAACLDEFVVNTCAVTSQAERQARQAIARAHRADPGRRITVTGCAVQIAPERWAALPGVARVLGNHEKLRARSWGEGASGGVADIMREGCPPAQPATGFVGRARATLQVQQGCDHRCTFCVIPFGRGKNRSVPAEVLADRLCQLVTAGYHEVVLTGVDIASYGRDLPDRPTLGELARTLLAKAPGLARLRLSSLDPAAIDETLWSLLAAEPRLAPHLHLSLQAASDLVLKRMKRRHDAGQADAVVARARALRPGLAIGADLIAGFPTETDALFGETLAFLQAHALPYLHVFPYSERPGTPASRMPPVPHAVRRTRAALLRAEGVRAAAAFHAAQIGTMADIVTEAAPDGMAFGHTAPDSMAFGHTAPDSMAFGHTGHFAPVRLAGTWPPGRLVRGRITGANADGLLAEAA